MGSRKNPSAPGEDEDVQLGERPEACDYLERIARTVLDDARVWRGVAETPEGERGAKVLGTPLGHPVFLQHQLARVRAHQQVLLDRIPAILDVQSACSPLSHCAATRATYFIPGVPPEWAVNFSRSHDAALWDCSCRVSCARDPRGLRCSFHWPSAGWDYAAQNAPEYPPVGPVGKIH